MTMLTAVNVKLVIVGDDVSIQCTTLHEIGFTRNGGLGLFSLSYFHVFFQKTVYFPILAHKVLTSSA